MKNCFLVLANGCAFEGTRFGADSAADGELVFTTSSSYMGTLTDPCYSGQIVLQTSPLIGNYGTISSEMDSGCCHPAGYIVKEWCDFPVNFNSEGDIDSFLKLHGVAGVCGVDTRQITRILREEGTMRAAIADAVTPELLAKLSEPLTSVPMPVSQPALHKAKGDCRATVAFINCSAPHSCINELTQRGVDVHEFSHSATSDAVLGVKPCAVVIGDGPGNPADAPDALIDLIKTCSKTLPMLGIGLGHLLMCRALGTATYKLHHGHRGANQPIQRTSDGKVFICSLNQGYAAQQPADADVSFKNINDDTVAGIDYGKSMSVQFVPDGTLGPLRTDFVYDEFLGRVVG